MSGKTTSAAAAVVLAGGRSRRMGTDKALLSWGDGSLLGHVLGVLGTAVAGPLVVVGAAGSPRRVDDARVVAVTDDAPDRGPLQGLATGLSAAATHGSTVAFVCSVDLPLLHPAYVVAVLAALGDAEVALPVLHGHRQPLAAAYRTALGARATALLAVGARRPGDLFAASTVRELSAADLLADPALRAVDPGLDAVRDVDTPEEYEALVRRVEPPPAPTSAGRLTPRHDHRNDEDPGSWRPDPRRPGDHDPATTSPAVPRASPLGDPPPTEPGEPDPRTARGAGP